MFFFYSNILRLTITGSIKIFLAKLIFCFIKYIYIGFFHYLHKKELLLLLNSVKQKYISLGIFVNSYIFLLLIIFKLF